MEEELLYEDTERNALYKTDSGVEIRASLRKKHSDNSTNMAYYYAWYSMNSDKMTWEISTNKLLYGERKVIIECQSREEAEKTAHAINNFIHLLIENI